MRRPSGGRVLTLAAGGAALGLVAVLAIAMSVGVGGLDAGRSDPRDSSAAPFAVETFDGEPFALDDYASGPVFIYFWASWCLPCDQEAPIIESVWPEYRDREWTFVGINIWDIEDDARKFIERHGLTFPNAPDRGRDVYIEYGVQALPVAYVISPGLQVHARFDGALDEATLRTMLDEVTPAGG